LDGKGKGRKGKREIKKEKFCQNDWNMAHFGANGSMPGGIF
jgi:hypothetical protein